ncbi:MAG: Na+/H+ antiporter NhaA [Chloroflexota bacterium]
MAPFRQFAQTEASGGILLILAAILAMMWANAPWDLNYDDFWHTYIGIEAGPFALEETLQHWINDGLMVIFFFVVGLEIKREILVGELASARKAMLPVAGAFGGAVVPAGIYLVFNAGTNAQDGWGIPMATDIAFSLGVLALLGSRVPLALKVFLTAFAIVDDIIAVLVIALFYTSSIEMSYLILGAGVLLILALANILHVNSLLVYSVLGVVLWLAFLQSGVHATIAGVLLAFTIPARTRIDTESFIAEMRESLDQFVAAASPGESILTNPEHQSSLHKLQDAIEEVESPMAKLEHALHPWTSFVIIPIFALANAGVYLGDMGFGALTSPIALGVALGLIFGKQLGITLLTWIAVRFGLTDLPSGIGWSHIYGAATLGGIGFTMSLFIGGLAFESDDTLNFAKVGILGGSLISGLVGYGVLRVLLSPDVEGSKY